MTTRERLLFAAAKLLASGGREAVSTRAVCAAVGVQAPTLYRLFGDKDGLLEAVAAHGLREYLASKQALPETDDPVDDLRRLWNIHVDFGLSRPAFYTLTFGDGGPTKDSPTRREIMARLRQRIARVGEAGRLRMSVDRATYLFHATGMGVVLTLLSVPPDARDPGLSPTAREQALRTISTGGPPPPDRTAAGRAAALCETLRGTADIPLTATERALLAEWLDRIANNS
ncbi:TetR/AcrR family transcriptional regulator [Nonomuraea terrae]|uniref:TetR/AcrR family transcriptional regulator n=1 Tax=Nonomuraea terrae TaxID=2530383 RepID=UPI0037B8B316